MDFLMISLFSFFIFVNPLLGIFIILKLQKMSKTNDALSAKLTALEAGVTSILAKVGPDASDLTNAEATAIGARIDAATAALDGAIPVSPTV